MKTKLILLTALFFFIFETATAFDAKLTFTSVPSTAKIYFNGELSGTGKATIELERAILVEVKIVAEGYITFQKSYRYGKGSQFAKNEGVGGYERGKNEYTITLDEDPSYVSPQQMEENLNKVSVLTDSINKYINCNVNKKYSQADSWKIVNKVVGDYFDDLDNTNSETGTLKTPWQAQIVGSQKIRTRLIIKTNDDGSYKIKIQSEYSDNINVSVKEDETFKEWDRVLKKYSNLIIDLNNKLK